MKRLFKVEHPRDGVYYFENKRQAKDFRDDGAHKNLNLKVSVGPDHWKYTRK